MKKLLNLILMVCISYSCLCQSSASKFKAMPGEAARLENRFNMEVVGKHNPELLNEILGEDFISHHFPAPGKNNKMAFTEGMKGLFAGFPDLKITTVEQHEQGDKVYTYAYWEGTHTGIFMGVPPTNKKAHVEYMDIWRVRDGKIRENWVVMDIMGLMIQLGVIPAPGSANK